MSGPFRRTSLHSTRARGVIQGSFRGGLPVIQARFKGSPSAAVQAQGRPGVEAFPVDLRPKAGGEPLPPEVQAKMESVLGADFSDVRIHVGREAASVGAIAFTWGSDIHFAPGQYSPHSAQGQRLLGHELAHVVQQRAGRVSNPFGSGVAVVQDHALEAEADRLGAEAAMAPAPSRRTEAVQPKLASPAAVVQRFHAQPSVQTAGGPRIITVTGAGSSRPIGSVKLWSRNNGVVEITNMHVQRQHRRQGAGKALMSAAIQAARRQGFSVARLEASPYDGGMSTQALASMYERMGFQPVGLSRRGNPIMERSTGVSGSVPHRVRSGRKPAGRTEVGKTSVPVLQARMANSRGPASLQGRRLSSPGVIQAMQSNQDTLEPMILDVTNSYNGRNDSGVVFGTVIPRPERTYGLKEVDERFLRHVSNFFFWCVNNWCEKGDAEVESMWVNNRLCLSSNNPGTMKQLFEYMKTEKSLLDFFLNTFDSDERGTRMLNTFDSIYQSPNTKSEVAQTLQGLSFDKIEDVIKLVNVKQLPEAITSPLCSEKVILVYGLNQHAEQKLMVGLANSTISKDATILIRGKKRPCFGCWFGLCFVSEFLGYSNLRFNPHQGKAWVGSIRTLGSLIDVALRSGKKEEQIKDWIDKKNIQAGTKKTHVSMFGGFEDPGYDSGSDHEDSVI